MIIHTLPHLCLCFRDITLNFQHNLISVDHTKGEATFARVSKDPVINVTMNVSKKEVKAVEHSKIVTVV